MHYARLSSDKQTEVQGDAPPSIRLPAQTDEQRFRSNPIMTNITTSAKPLAYYCPRGAEMLIAAFGDRLEALPKIEKFYILMVVGAMGSHDLDPNFAGTDYDANSACEDHAIFLDFDETLLVDIKAVLDDMTADQLLGLAEFLIIDLRTTKPVKQ